MRHLRVLLAGLLLSASMTLLAEEDFSAVEEGIRALAPNATSIAVSETPIDGILMVQVMGDILYATADGKYLIQGRVIDMKTREDLTEAAKADVRKELLAGLDDSQQITFSPEKALNAFSF